MESYIFRHSERPNPIQTGPFGAVISLENKDFDMSFCETSTLLFLPESGKPCGEGRCLHGPRLRLLTELLPAKGPPVETARFSQLQHSGALWKYPQSQGLVGRIGAIISTEITIMVWDVNQQFKEWYGSSITEIHGSESNHLQPPPPQQQPSADGEVGCFPSIVSNPFSLLIDLACAVAILLFFMLFLAERSWH